MAYPPRDMLRVRLLSLVLVVVAALVSGCDGDEPTVVLLVAFALVGLSARPGLPVDGPDGGNASRTRAGVGTAIAVLCVLAAGLIVSYGFYLIIA